MSASVSLAACFIVAAGAAAVALEMRTLPDPDACYGFVGVIAVGQDGVVHRCRPRTADGDVAVKVVQRDLADPKTRADLEQEVAFLMAFAHDSDYAGVPRLFDLFQVDGRPHLVLQLFEGRELFDLPRPYDADRIMTLLFKAVAVLERVHARGYVHGDVSLQNVLCNDADDVMLVDFSGIRMASRDRRAVEPQPLGNSATVGYVAPEMAARQLYGYASDIFSLGRCCALLIDKDAFEQRDSRRRLRRVGRLADFIDRTTNPDYRLRPTAADLLAGPIFAAERRRLLLFDRIHLSGAALRQIVRLEDAANRARFAAFPDPADPARSLPYWPGAGCASPAAAAREPKPVLTRAGRRIDLRVRPPLIGTPKIRNADPKPAWWTRIRIRSCRADDDDNGAVVDRQRSVH